MKRSRGIFDILIKVKNIIIGTILRVAACIAAVTILLLLAWCAIGWR